MKNKPYDYDLLVSVCDTPLHISPTDQSPTIGSDGPPDSRVGICVPAFSKQESSLPPANSSWPLPPTNTNTHSNCRVSPRRQGSIFNGKLIYVAAVYIYHLVCIRLGTQ